MLELHHFGVQGAKLALHSQRPGFVGASAGDHAALVTSAVRSDESELRIVTSKPFRGAGVIGQVSSFETRQKLFGSRAQGIAKFNQLVEAGDDTILDAEIYDWLVISEA